MTFRWPVFSGVGECGLWPGCALLRRLRLAAATLLKVWLEAVAKMVVQRDRPAETLPDVILHGQSAAHGLGCPSGHAMVIFAITALVAPYFKGW
jgi:membrane-associated phospholipid phosphatase